MKKLILLFTFICINLVSFSQVAKQPLDAASRAKRTTVKMSQELGLTTDQQTKVQVINLEKANALNANREKHANDNGQFESGKKIILTKWNADLSAVFNPEQLIKWNKFIAEKKTEIQKKSK